MRNGLKVALFVSAFSPSLIAVGAARLIGGAAVWDAIYYIGAGIFGCLTVIYILSALKYYGEKFPFQAKKIESNDALLLGVILSYIFPFFVKANEITVISVVLLFFVLWFVFWFTDVSLPSPLMRVFGFRFYKAESANGMVYTLITSREILDPANVKFIKKLSSSMILEIRK